MNIICTNSQSTTGLTQGTTYEVLEERASCYNIINNHGVLKAYKKIRFSTDISHEGTPLVIVEPVPVPPTEEEIFKEKYDKIRERLSISTDFNLRVRDSSSNSSSRMELKITGMYPMLTCGICAIDKLNTFAGTCRWGIIRAARILDIELTPSEKSKMQIILFEELLKDQLKRRWDNLGFGMWLFSTNFNEAWMIPVMDKLFGPAVVTNNPNEGHNIATWLFDLKIREGVRESGLRRITNSGYEFKFANERD